MDGAPTAQIALAADPVHAPCRQRNTGLWGTELELATRRSTCDTHVQRHCAPSLSDARTHGHIMGPMQPKLNVPVLVVHANMHANVLGGTIVFKIK